MKFNQKWVGYIFDEKKDVYEKFPAKVPGNIQMDFAEYMGWLEDLQYSNNAKKLEPYRNCFWKYETILEYKNKDDEKVFFVAQGIDYEFDIILNGIKIFHQEGMYTPVEIEITDKVKSGDILEVLIYPHPTAPHSFPNSRDEARASCKPPVTYGWDWNPHLLISGIWKPAYIETRKKDYINQCELFYELDLETKTVNLHFDVDCEEDVLCSVSDACGNVLYCGEAKDCVLTDVSLWWCNGQGEPYLYNWSVKSENYMKTGKIGFRTVKLVKNIGTLGEPGGFPKSRYAAPITIELNGRRIFAKGSNWVNPELFFGAVTRERYSELIGFAKQANMNILRVWGGAGICKDEFYEECDRQGIMVWQEFMLACNNYEGTPEYLAVLEQEARTIILNLRKYTSIVLWCGGNELFNGWSGMDDQSLPLRLLNSLCYLLDQKTPFLMTSPLMGMGHGGYFFRFEGKDVFQFLNHAHYTAYTEFGVPNITDEEELKKIIPDDELFPIKRTPSWSYHNGFDAWGAEAWCFLDTLKHYFGDVDSLQQYCDKSSWLQCSGYQAIFEEARRQWPYCSMALNWCFNEPWINAAGNNLITYPNKLKQSYFAVKNSLRSMIPSARLEKFDWNSGEVFKAEIWYLNDSPDIVSDEIDVSVIIGDEEYKMFSWNTGDVGALSNKIGPSVNYQLPPIGGIGHIILKLKSKYSDRDNEYKLLYRCVQPPIRTMQLNV